MTAKKPAAPVPPKFYVMAENRAIAKNQLELELKWKRNGQTWTDPAGNKVSFISGDQFAKLSAGARVYLGYRWYAHIAAHFVHNRAKAEGIILIDQLPANA